MRDESKHSLGLGYLEDTVLWTGGTTRLRKTWWLKSIAQEKSPTCYTAYRPFSTTATNPSAVSHFHMPFFHDTLRAFVKVGCTARPPTSQVYSLFFNFGKLCMVGRATWYHPMCQLQTTSRGGLEYDVEGDAKARENDGWDWLVMPSEVRKGVVVALENPGW